MLKFDRHKPERKIKPQNLHIIKLDTDPATQLAVILVCGCGHAAVERRVVLPQQPRPLQRMCCGPRSLRRADQVRHLVQRHSQVFPVAGRKPRRAAEV